MVSCQIVTRYLDIHVVSEKMLYTCTAHAILIIDNFTRKATIIEMTIKAALCSFTFEEFFADDNTID
jgi:hypothetical protein